MGVATAFDRDRDPDRDPAVLEALAGRIAVAPTRARDRYLPVAPAFADLLPDAGLVRGRVVGCRGPAAFTLAFSLVAAAAQAGSWVAVVGLPAVGFEALDELGIPLERVVLIDAEGASVWAERVAATADGFEVVVTRPPAGAERVARRVRQRLQSNGVVLVAADVSAPALGTDLDLVTSDVTWHGLGQGWGHLAARRARVQVEGRRVPRPVARELLLPGPDGRVHVVEPDHGADSAVVPLHRTA